ncbi:MAG: ABC transporter permease [Thermoplasmata archaeon]|nr:ABC transporter permease [Thermoplasmata archaeon]
MPESPAQTIPTATGSTAQPLPPTQAQILVLARYQFLDYLRSNRFLLMLGLDGIIGIILTSVVAYFRPAGLLASATDFYGSLWVGGVTVVVVFAGVIFGGDAIAGEFQNRTGYFLMGQPIRRVTVYIGKYLAAFVASLITVVVFAVILLANGTYYFGAGAFPGAFAVSFWLVLLFMLALLGATFMFSSLFKTSTYATLVVAVLFLFGFSILQVLVAEVAKLEPWFLISYASPIIGYPFDATLPAHATMVSLGPGGGSFTSFNPTYPEGIAILLGYFVLTALLGLFLFEREEFT